MPAIALNIMSLPSDDLVGTYRRTGQKMVDTTMAADCAAWPGVVGGVSPWYRTTTTLFPSCFLSLVEASPSSGLGGLAMATTMPCSRARACAC